MAQKCVHKGCGKAFTDPEEPCVYHPGPPVFHEGQKGWRCCKPRVLTFDEFMNIPPCTTGRHSTVDDTPPPPIPSTDNTEAPSRQPRAATNGAIISAAPDTARLPLAKGGEAQTIATPAAPESESDETSAPLPLNTKCRRRGCDTFSSSCNSNREGEQCVYHPGQALFHEGSKGWTCCKRRVLEFEEFMRIQGCKTRNRHCFVGKRRKKVGEDGQGHEEEFEKLSTVRHDFYQTSTTVHASFFLKKVEKDNSSIEFPEPGLEIKLDLRTLDKKHYAAVVPLYGKIDPSKSTYKILGTKVELTLAKSDGQGWPVLRSDERLTGEIIQTGRAGRVA